MKTLQKQIKPNAGSVNCDLRGGKHAHLSLILPDTDYAKLSTDTNTKPTHPGPLNIPTATAHHEVVCLHKEHNEKLYIFREAINIENILISQILQAIKAIYS